MEDETFDSLFGALPQGGVEADIDHHLLFGNAVARRTFLKQIAGTGAAIAIGPSLLAASKAAAAEPSTVTSLTPPVGAIDVKLKINGKDFALPQLDPRVTLLDALRERLH